MNPLIPSLKTWIDATDLYSEFEPPDHAASILAAATCSLVRELAPFVTMPTWRERVTTIVTNVLAATGRYLGERYGDDDTDAPCDVEWDVHSLVHALEPTYDISEEIEPAHVLGTAFPHPSDSV